jgi:hypothetical protein
MDFAPRLSGCERFIDGLPRPLNCLLRGDAIGLAGGAGYDRDEHGGHPGEGRDSQHSECCGTHRYSDVAVVAKCPPDARCCRNSRQTYVETCRSPVRPAGSHEALVEVRPVRREHILTAM